MERLVERLFGSVFARLGVECSTFVIANVLVWTRSVRFARTARASLMGVPGHGEQTFNPGITLVVFVMEVVIGHG